MLLDSNIIIYAIRPEHAILRELIAAQAPSVSAVSYVEVLGYHLLTAEDAQDLSDFFAAANILPVSQPVIYQATVLRRQRRMTLGDAIIAATALVNGLALLTANARDFAWIQGLDVRNPLEQSDPDGE